MENNLNQLKITNVTYSILFQFEKSSTILIFYSYLTRCFESFIEEKNALKKELKINPDVLMKRQNYSFFETILTKHVELKCPNIFTSECLNQFGFNEFLSVFNEVLDGCYSSCQINYGYLQSIINFFILIFTERMIYALTCHKCLETVHDGITFACKMKEIKDNFNFTDLRIDIIFKFLVLSYKRMCYNNLADEILLSINRLLDRKLVKNEIRRELEDIFTTFSAKINQYLQDFLPFSSHFCFATFVCDGFKKLFYYFFNSINILFDKDALRFTLRECFYMLNRVFQISKEAERILTEAKINFKRSNVTWPNPNTFKRLMNELVKRIFESIKININILNDKKLKDIDFDSFDFMELITSNFEKVLFEIENVHAFYAIRIRNIFLFQIVEKVMTQILKKKQLQNDKSKLILVMNNLINFFKNEVDEDEGSCFVKFFEYFLKFLKSGNKESCKTDLGMMMKILGENIHEASALSMIHFKQYKNLKFDEDRLLKSFRKVLYEDEIGTKEFGKRTEYKKTINWKLSLVFCAVKFYIKMRKIVLKKQPEISSEIFKKDCLKTITQKFDIIGVQSFYKDCNVLLLPLENFQDMKNQPTIESIFDKLALFVELSNVIRFSNNCVTIVHKSEKRHLQNVKMIFYSAKIEFLERIVTSKLDIVTFTYDKCFRVVLDFQKDTQIEIWYEDLSKIIDVYKDLSPTEKRLDIETSVEAYVQTKFFKLFFLKNTYKLKLPKALKDSESILYPNYHSYGFTYRVDDNQPVKIIVKRKTIEDLFKVDLKLSEADKTPKEQPKNVSVVVDDLDDDDFNETCKVQSTRLFLEDRKMSWGVSASKTESPKKAKNQTHFSKHFAVLLSKITEESNLSENDFYFSKFGEENPKFVRRYLHNLKFFDERI